MSGQLLPSREGRRCRSVALVLLLPFGDRNASSARRWPVGRLGILLKKFHFRRLFAFARRVGATDLPAEGDAAAKLSRVGSVRKN